MGSRSEIKIVPLPSQVTGAVKDKTDPRLFRKYFFAVYNGARFSGKTLNIAVITKQFFKKQYKSIIIFTPNPADPSWNPLRSSKKVHIFDRLSNDILNFIHEEQLKEFVESGKKKDLLLIIDDHNMQKGHKKALDELVTRGRHAGISVIITSQYFMHNSTAVRANTTNWIIFRPLRSELTKMVEAGLNLAVPEEIFRSFVLENTREPFHFVHINLQSSKRPFREGFS